MLILLSGAIALLLIALIVLTSYFRMEVRRIYRRMAAFERVCQIVNWQPPNGGNGPWSHHRHLSGVPSITQGRSRAVSVITLTGIAAALILVASSPLTSSMRTSTRPPIALPPTVAPSAQPPVPAPTETPVRLSAGSPAAAPPRPAVPVSAARRPVRPPPPTPAPAQPVPPSPVQPPGVPASPVPAVSPSGLVPVDVRPLAVRIPRLL